MGEERKPQWLELQTKNLSAKLNLEGKLGDIVISSIISSIVCIISLLGFNFFQTRDTLSSIKVNSPKKIEGTPIPHEEGAWIAVKIIGTGFGFYPHNRSRQASSLLTPLIYTDSNDKNFSTLKNVDQDLPGVITKHDSQHFQARLMQYGEKPICLHIYGYRHPSTSEYFNIIGHKLWPNNKEYEPNLDEKRASEACGE